MYIARGPRRAALRMDARTGAVLPVARDEAEATARRDQRDAPEVVEASLVRRDAPIEYRDKPLPAWRVLLGDRAGTAVWIDARTGEITARRNERWRQYDFLWSLHIMDYRGRESFHHPLLIIAASIPLPWMAVLIANDRPPRTAEEVNRYHYGDQPERTAIAPSQNNVIEG